MVNLVYGGQIVHNEDTGVGQETFIVYRLGDTAGGTYTVEVCKSGNPATPFMPAGGPYPYNGVFTDVDASTRESLRAAGLDDEPGDGHPTPSYGTWNAKFSSATVVDPQRTEGEPLDLIDSDGTFWESGPWGTHNQNSFIHRSTNDGQEFHLVADTGLRPDLPPGGGDTDIATDDHGNVYFTDLEALANLGTSVSHDNGMTWTKNAAAVQNTRGRPAVVRGRQRADVLRGRQHGLPRVPPDLGRHVHLLVARLDGRRTIPSAASCGRTRRRTRARSGRSRPTPSAHRSASTPSRATSTTPATRAITSA